VAAGRSRLSCSAPATCRPAEPPGSTRWPR
jgi:hypothetical protein